MSTVTLAIPDVNVFTEFEVPAADLDPTAFAGDWGYDDGASGAPHDGSLFATSEANSAYSGGYMDGLVFVLSAEDEAGVCLRYSGYTDAGRELVAAYFANPKAANEFNRATSDLDVGDDDADFLRAYFAGEVPRFFVSVEEKPTASRYHLLGPKERKVIVRDWLTWNVVQVVEASRAWSGRAEDEAQKLAEQYGFDYLAADADEVQP